MTTEATSQQDFHSGLFPILALVFLSIVGCSRFEIGDGRLSDKGAGPAAAKATRPEDLSPEDRKAEAEILTDEGEDLYGPGALDDAYGKFKEALQYDPENVRAGFHSAMLGPFLELRGIVARVKPFYLKRPEGAERYARWVDKFNGGTANSWRSFLLNGPADIDSMEGVAEWMDRVLLRISQFREYIKAHKNEEVSLRVPDGFFFTSSSNVRSIRCAPTQVGPIKIRPANCNEKNYQDFTLNRADMEYLQAVWGGIQAYFWFLNSYSINPDILFDMGLPQGKIEALHKSNPIRLLGDGKYGKLRGKDRFALVKNVIGDLAVAQRYFYENQREICNRTSQAKQRGAVTGVIGQTACIGDLDTGKSESERTMNMLEAIVSGQPADLSDLSADGKPIEFKVWEFFDQPITDLNAFQPMTFKDGHVKTFNTAVLNKYFAHGSMEEVMEAWERRDEESQAQAIVTFPVIVGPVPVEVKPQDPVLQSTPIPAPVPAPAGEVK